MKGGLEYNHVFVNQTFGFNQFGRFIISGTDTATQLDILSVGGTIANRFDSRDVTYLRQLGNLQLEFPTDEIAFFAQDAWKIRPNFTINYGLRWEGASNPTPEANNDFMLNALQGFTFPIGRHYLRRNADSGPVFAVRPACRLCLGPRQRRPHGAARLHRHLLRADAGAALGGAHEQFPHPRGRPVVAASADGARRESRTPPSTISWR